MTLRLNRTFLFLTALAILGGEGAPAAAQSLRLRQVGTNQNRISVQVGQIINIEVFADLQGAEAAGVSFFVSVPKDAFLVRDNGLPGQPGTQPFVAGSGTLFFGAQEPVNLLLPESDAVAATFPGQQLDYNAIIGAGSNRRRTGSGVVATFSLTAVAPIVNGRIALDDNPIRETKLFLTDGVTQQRFITLQGMEITVTGLELRDIPDVILTPGQSDSVQIGSLDQYIGNTLSVVDSIRWSFEPQQLDSLEITIDPVTRVVRVVPLFGWKGRQRIIWTATEVRGVVLGLTPLSTTEVSIIVVNNPPEFLFERGPDGVKRDTVRIREDRHTFIPGATSQDARFAFRGRDLDLFVDDPDVEDPNIELNFVVTAIGVSTTQPNVIGDQDANTNELLIWSRPNFSGIDSLQVLVQDEFRARDTLRVIVEVEAVPDPPRFTLQDREPRISRGGTKTYVLADILEDVDTPLDSLILTFVNDPNFTVDTVRVAGQMTVRIVGDSRFIGLGRITFQAADPLDPVNLNDTMLIFIQSAEALPPAVFPPEVKIGIATGGSDTESLDDFVEDPDNDDSELAWDIPSITISQIGIDANRVITVTAPPNFVGYEEVVLTVSDPAGQSDDLKLRIYASDGRPVVGGIPDLILDRGEQNREFDLDSFYFDLDNDDEEMIWRVLDTFNTSNLLVGIDALTHVVTYFVPETAVFKTETVVFRVTDPAGSSAEDSVLVTIRSGGASTGGAFQLTPLPPLQAAVGSVVVVLDLDDHLQVSPSVSRSSIIWRVTRQGRLGPAILNGTKVSVFGQEAGLDTLEFTATDSLGQSKKISTTVRFLGVNEVLKLAKIPDIVFIAGQPSTDLRLSDFILDKETHPDSLIEWEAQIIGDETGQLFIIISDSTDVLAISSAISESQVVFAARNSAIGVTGRDTVRVIALDPALAAGPLDDLPPVFVVAGKVDSSITLNDFLPEDILTGFFTNWLVSGGSITAPVVDPVAPHVLTIRTIGERVGIDTLRLVVDLGGGRTASGELIVTVTEPVDDTTLELHVIPNHVNPEFVDVFVVARRQLASSPTVIWSFGTIDSTLAVRQIEDDLEGRGVLIWSGVVRLPSGASGTVSFAAQAITVLNTPVQASTSIALGMATAGKIAAIQHNDVELVIPAGAVQRDTPIVVHVTGPDRRASATVAEGVLPATAVGESQFRSELVLRSRVDIYPVGLQLKRPGIIRVLRSLPASAGVYIARGGGGWTFVGAASSPVEINSLGRYGILEDGHPPELTITSLPGQTDLGFTAEVADGGSGVDVGSLSAFIDDSPVPVRNDAGRLSWEGTALLAEGPHVLKLSVRDRAGNETVQIAEFEITASSALPVSLQLGDNYPNPFNPETSIPLAIPSHFTAASAVRLVIYNAVGQRVRVLGTDLLPGRHTAVWDGRDHSGHQVSSGIYLYRLESASAAITRRMTLLK